MSEVEAREWLMRHLGVADVAHLSRTAVDVTPDRSIDLIDLLLGYGHVVRMERELELPDSDRSVWGAYDLIAADCLRGFIDQGLGLISEGEAASFLRALEEVDSRFCPTRKKLHQALSCDWMTKMLKRGDGGGSAFRALGRYAESSTASLRRSRRWVWSVACKW